MVIVKNKRLRRLLADIKDVGWFDISEQDQEWVYLILSSILNETGVKIIK